MAVVTGHNLARSFGADDIFWEVNVSIPHGARIALVGPNGAGKTTLLRILARLDTPDAGSIHHARGIRIGFLPQEAEMELAGEQTVWEEMLTAFDELRRQEGKLEEMAEKLAGNPDDAELLASYGEAQTRFETEGGYEYTTRIQMVLNGLGFDARDFERPISQLSGGQKTRALLARLLLESPDLLILDEPTNHLDIEAIEWLESWIKDFPGAMLAVSHDRYFMDSVVRNVWELIFGTLQEYRGNYSHYIQQREERHAFLLKEWERQQEFIQKEQAYIQRNIAGQNTRQAQGRRKRLERYLRDEAIARPRQHHTMSLKMATRRRSGDKVIMTEGLVIGYHDDRVPLFNAPDITLYRGECAALIGPNGAGKSTFIKTILGQLEPLDGRVRIGASVEIGYFAQAHEELHPERTIFDEILSIKEMPISEVRHYLGRFLFSGDDVYRPVSTLSGGERGRVALAKLALMGANLLLLDEPTNHLDIPSQEILEAVLTDFDGTILLVSHDRYLIRDLATQIWALRIDRRGSEKPELVVHEGPYDDYMALREGRSITAKPATADSRSEPTPIEATATRSGLTPFQRKRRLEEVEAAIHRLEIEMVNLQGALESASTGGNVDEVTRLGQSYHATETRLAKLMDEWEALLIEE